MEITALTEERKRLGLIIAERRNDLKMTQLELAEKSGVQKPHLSDMENGKKNVGIDNINKVMNALNLQLVAIIIKKTDKK